MKMRKTVAFLLATVLLLTCAVFVDAATLKGDVDCNGKVEADDARLVLRYAVGLEALGKTQKSNADMDNDGYITASDARAILRKAVGLVDFDSILLSVARQYYSTSDGYGYSSGQMLKANGSSTLETVYRTAGKWCCYYTVEDVFRPALKKAGYSDARINELAPVNFDAAKISKAANVVIKEALETEKVTISKSAFSNSTAIYIPSLLMDYYRTNNGKYDDFYTFYGYYDDMITDSYYGVDTDASGFKVQVGDVVFMSNKSSTYHNGIPTNDHTAQVIEVYSDGSFLCTEGSIVVEGVPDKLPRVRERAYAYSKKIGTFVYKNNTIVRVLAIARPYL